MSEATPQTVADLLRTFRDGLAAWAQTNGGKVTIVSDPWAAVNLLILSPGSFNAVLLWGGSKKRGELEEAGVDDVTMLLVLSQGKGFARVPGQHLADAIPGGKPLYQLCDEALAIARGILFSDGVTEGSLNYTGADPVTAEGGTPLDAYQLTFTIGRHIPLPVAPEESSSAPSSSAS